MARDQPVWFHVQYIYIL